MESGRKMKVKDKVYGEIEINEPVLIDLINSDQVQRLKKISQFGLPSEYYHIPVYYRYEHSIGVLLLLRILNADLKEQIAGLIHDISHTAFSHVIDWVIGDSTKEDYQDNTFSKFLKESGIPLILKKNGFNYRNFLDLDKFTLLEQPAPSLCADRVDYSMREIKDFENKENTDLILDSIKNIDKKMVFSNKKAAEIFARGYMKCQSEHWAGDQAKARFHILAEILKKALNKQIIDFKDIKTTDDRIINILNSSGDENIIEGLELLKKGFEVKEADKGGIILKKKFRYVDPEVLIEGSTKRLSEISPDYFNFLEIQKKTSFNSKKVKIVKI